MTQFDARPGLLAGGAAIVIGLIFYLISPEVFITYGGFITPLPMLYFVYQSAVSQRTINGGTITFKDAFKHSWVTYLIYSLLTSIFLYFLYNHIDPELNDTVLQKATEALEKFRSKIGDEETDKMIEALENSSTQNLQNILFGFLTSLIIPGAVFAAIAALIVKREPNVWETKDIV